MVWKSGQHTRMIENFQVKECHLEGTANSTLQVLPGTLCLHQNHGMNFKTFDINRKQVNVSYREAITVKKKKFLRNYSVKG